MSRGMSEDERLRAALEQALDRMETAWTYLQPVPTPSDREMVAQALWFGLEELRDALERPVFEEPAILGCGCIVGTHDNTSEAMHEAHPEVLGWDAVEDPHLRIGVGPPDRERLAGAVHAWFSAQMDHGGPVCQSCRDAADDIAAAYSSLSAVPGTETEPENEKSAASTAVGRDVR